MSEKENSKEPAAAEAQPKPEAEAKPSTPPKQEGRGKGQDKRPRRKTSRRADREQQEDGPRLQDKLVRINRCAVATKGGRAFSFSAVVCVGDMKGQVGFGFGKAREVPNAVEKATKDAQRGMLKVPMVGGTIPHEVIGRFGASQVKLIPASEGTGLIAGEAVRIPLELAGFHNILTKSLGSNNPINLVKAVFDAMSQLQNREMVQQLRGVTLEAKA